MTLKEKLCRESWIDASNGITDDHERAYGVGWLTGFEAAKELLRAKEPPGSRWLEIPLSELAALGEEDES